MVKNIYFSNALHSISGPQISGHHSTMSTLMSSIKFKGQYIFCRPHIRIFLGNLFADLSLSFLVK